MKKGLIISGIFFIITVLLVSCSDPLIYYNNFVDIHLVDTAGIQISEPLLLRTQNSYNATTVTSTLDSGREFSTYDFAESKEDVENKNFTLHFTVFTPTMKQLLDTVVYWNRLEFFPGELPNFYADRVAVIKLSIPPIRERR